MKHRTRLTDILDAKERVLRADPSAKVCVQKRTGFVYIRFSDGETAPAAFTSCEAWLEALPVARKKRRVALKGKVKSAKAQKMRGKNL